MSALRSLLGRTVKSIIVSNAEMSGSQWSIESNFAIALVLPYYDL